MRENKKSKEDDSKDFRIQYQSKSSESNVNDKYQNEKVKYLQTMFILTFDIFRLIIIFLDFSDNGDYKYQRILSFIA